MAQKTFDTFRREVLALYAPPLRARATRAKMAQALGELAASGVAAAAELTAPAVARWLAAHPDRTASTARSLLSSIRAACAYAVAAGDLRRSPFAFRRQWVRPEPPRPAPHHTRAEVARVLDLLGRESAATFEGGRLFALAAVVAHTGLRRGEALNLRRDDVVGATGTPGAFLAIRPHSGRRLKTCAAAAPVPLPAPALAVLRGWLARHDAEWCFPNRSGSGPWTGGPPGRKPLDALKAAGLRAGVAHFTFRSLRHTWGSLAPSWGLGELEVQQVLRHTSVRTQRWYIHADLPSLAAIGRRVHFGAAGAEKETAPMEVKTPPGPRRQAHQNDLSDRSEQPPCTLEPQPPRAAKTASRRGGHRP